MKNFARSALAAALALAAAPAVAETYSQTVFFGDSLTDAGYYRPLLPASVRPVTGQFTTNPGQVWAQFLADYYGTSATPNGNGQTGTNYAAGGARVGVNTVGALGPQPSLATQVNSYLTANGGRADANALYTVWGGANDLFAVAGGANPTTTIGSAVAAQVGLVGTLRNAGAQYILVPTVPDLGLTPQSRALGAAAQAQGTLLSTTYNNALFGGLAAANLQVIPVDTFNLLREVAANATAFGFANITGTACQPQITANSLTCNPTSYVTPNAGDTYLFADGVHPTSRAHQIVADLAVSVLEAPRQLAVLPHTAKSIGRARADRVAANAMVAEADGMGWWFDTRAGVPRYDAGLGHDGVAPAVTGGVNWTAGSFAYGVFGGFGRAHIDFAQRRGDFEQLDATLGGVVAWKADAAWVNAQLSYTQLRYEVDREVYLGPVKRSHEGSPDGSNVAFGVSAGYEFGDGALRHGPIASVLAQRIEIDGYDESDAALSTALGYDEQERDSLVGSIGWRARYAINDHVQPYAQLTYDKEFEDEDDQAFARALSIPGQPRYAVPGVDFDDTFATLAFGVRTQVMGFDADIGASASVGQRNGHEATVFASVSGGF